MEKYINEYGKECYRGATPDSPFSPELFHEVDMSWARGDTQVALHTNLGSLTVVDRLTGFGYRDVETGFRDLDGKFWLASGHCDVRFSNCLTLGEAIEWVKSMANICRGI